MGRARNIAVSISIFGVLSIAFLYLSDKIEECRTLLWSFARMFSPEIQQKCSNAGSYFLPLAFVWILSGLVSAGIIIAATFTKSIVGGIIVLIVIIIIALKWSQVI